MGIKPVYNVPMEYIVNSYANIAFEATCILFLLILLTYVLIQRSSFPAAGYIQVLCVLNISLLLLQILQWVGAVNYFDGSDIVRDMYLTVIVYSLDFALVFWISFAFFKYMEAHIRELSKGDETQMVPGFISKILIAVGALNQLLMLLLSSRGLVFYIDENATTRYTWVYVPLFLVGYLCLVTCLVLAVKYRKVLGHYDMSVFLIYSLSSMLTFPISMVFNISLSYVIPSLMLYVLFLGVGNRRERELLEQKTKVLEREAELERKNVQIMVSQIQPHFLYNTLSVIDYLCGKDVELARSAINSFSEYIRTNMESIGSLNPVPFEKELEHTKTYLWIEKMRFSDILKIEYDIGFKDFRIPPLTLQPIVENAVKHGIRGREEGGCVRISSHRDGADVVITVEDDGMGFDTDAEPDMDRIHVGIENVKSRLAMICKGSLTIDSTPGRGTVATIRIGDDLDDSFTG